MVPGRSIDGAGDTKINRHLHGKNKDDHGKLQSIQDCLNLRKMLKEDDEFKFGKKMNDQGI